MLKLFALPRFRTNICLTNTIRAFFQEIYTAVNTSSSYLSSNTHEKYFSFYIIVQHIPSKQSFNLSAFIYLNPIMFLVKEDTFRYLKKTYFILIPTICLFGPVSTSQPILPKGVSLIIRKGTVYSIIFTIHRNNGPCIKIYSSHREAKTVIACFWINLQFNFETYVRWQTIQVTGWVATTACTYPFRNVFNIIKEHLLYIFIMQV